MKKLTDIQLYEGGGFTGFGPLGQGGSDSVSVFAKFISLMIGLMTIIAIIWFVFIFIMGAIGIITSGGDKQALEGAKKKIVNGLIGLVVTILAILIIRLIGSIVGLENILNIESMFNNLIIN